MGGPGSRTPRSRAGEVLDILQATWPSATCELDHRSAFELTVATILSAQSTDRRVNLVTPELFRRFPTPGSLAAAEPSELEALIHSTGFFRQKARSLVGMARMVVTEFGGEMPRTMEEMVRLFSLERVGVANPKFSRDKLLAFNTEACAAASPQRLLAAFKDFLSVNPDSPVNRATDEQLEKLLAMKKGFRTLREVEELSRCFFVPDEQIEYDPAAVEKVLKKSDGEGARVLREVREVLAAAADWNHVALEAAVKQYCEQKSLGLGKVAQPIRVAVSGSTISPPIFESLELLGKGPTLARIDRCLMRLG